MDGGDAIPPPGSLLGTAFVTLVEPEPGFEQAYEEWYAADHFYTGAMALPYWFAGRRWTATPELKAHRQVAPGVLPGGPHDGTHLATYWILRGHFVDQLRALRRTVEELYAASRMFPQRRHVSSLFYERVTGVRGPRQGPRDHQALDAEWAGLVLEFVDVDRPAERAALLDALPTAIGAALVDEGIDLAVVLTPHPWPSDVELWFDYGPVHDTRITVLWFLTVDPLEVMHRFDRAARPLGGRGRSTLVAPFRPLTPGRDVAG